MSKNTNCLEGIRCPKCGYEDKFNIAVTCWAEFTDEGSDTYGDNEWDENAAMQCCSCDHHGKVADFMIDNQGNNKRNEQGKLVVKIEVRGGVAEVVSQPDSVYVEIHDYDNDKR